MKKSIFLFLLSFVLTGSMLRAQVPMAIPNGSFEQWTNHSGYSVSLLFMSFPVYDAFSTPSVWDYPSYPVNQTVSYMGMNININTSVPLVKSTQETGTVPDGNKAVKLQTFMLDDIIDPTMLSLAGDYLDTTLTQQVIPSILSTGAVDIDAFIPLINSIMSGTGDLLSMLPTLLAVDVNDYITGGIALGDFRPGRLSGSYKYHSTVGGDNGGVLMLGTRYNSVTHRRDIVGAGMNLALVDTALYTPFEAEYMSLGGSAPDSLVIFLLSSAGENRQQGSYLCLDNLMLWPAPDTCADITALSAVPDIHEAQLSWTVSDAADGFELEYGPEGFTSSTGSDTTLASNILSFSLTGLDANTIYEVHVRSLCSDTIYGEWDTLQFTTLADTCASVLNLTLENQVYDAFPQMVLEWGGSSVPDHWEVEYGPQGFIHGDGTVVETSQPYFAIYELEDAHILTPNTWYDFYVRSVCGEEVFGDWDSVHYRTFCARVDSVVVGDSNLSVTADHRISGYTISWVDTTETRSWGVYYGIYNPQFPDNWGTYVEVDTPWFEFPPLLPDKTYSIEISVYCGEDNYGEIVWVNFHTPSLEGIDPLAVSESHFRVSPNPANGQCTVTVLDDISAELKLYTLDGRLLQTFATDGSPVVLNLPWQGVFLLQATTPTGTATHKIISR